MKQKIILLVIVIVALVVAGVWVLTNSGGSQDSNKFTIDVSGGSISYLDKVVFSVNAGTFDKEMKIAITNYADSTQNSGITILSAYEFGPSGLVFDPPAELVIHYNPSDIPKTSSESDLGVYMLEGNNWVLMAGSSVNKDENTVSAPVKHFSKMACGASSTGSATPGDLLNGGEELEDGYATIWFRANISFYRSEYRHQFKPSEYTGTDFTEYTFGACVTWDPVEYTQYYQLKVDFKGNTPEVYAWSYDHSEQGQWISRGNGGEYNKKMGIIYNVGGDAYKDNFLLLDTIPERYGERYVVPLGYFIEKVYAAEVTEGLDVDFLLSGVEAAHHAYFEGWEIWVRAVIETPR